MRTGDMQQSGRHGQGFTYIGLLFIIALISITLAVAGTLWTFAQQREKERELLFVGNQFRHAIGMYYERSPGTIKRYPQSLDQLLEDDRYISLQRYLRKIYTDPMTGEAEWGIVTAPEGGVMGVYSQSSQRAIKTGNFRFVNRMLERQERYSDWKFVYIPVSSFPP